jgi:hypothetical protein
MKKWASHWFSRDGPASLSNQAFGSLRADVGIWVSVQAARQPYAPQGGPPQLGYGAGDRPLRPVDVAVQAHQQCPIDFAERALVPFDLAAIGEGAGYQRQPHDNGEQAGHRQAPLQPPRRAP